MEHLRASDPVYSFVSLFRERSQTHMRIIISLSPSTQAVVLLEILGVEETITSFLQELPPKELSSS